MNKEVRHLFLNQVAGEPVGEANRFQGTLSEPGAVVATDGKCPSQSN